MKIVWKKLSVVPVEKEDPELTEEKIKILNTTGLRREEIQAEDPEQIGGRPLKHIHSILIISHKSKLHAFLFDIRVSIPRILFCLNIPPKWHSFFLQFITCFKTMHGVEMR